MAPISKGEWSFNGHVQLFYSFEKICSGFKDAFSASELIMIIKKFYIPPHISLLSALKELVFTGVFVYSQFGSPMVSPDTTLDKSTLDKSSVVSHKPILTGFYFLFSPRQFSFVYIYFMCPLTSTVKLWMYVILTPGGSGRSLRAGKAINQQLLWVWKKQQWGLKSPKLDWSMSRLLTSALSLH